LTGWIATSPQAKHLAFEPTISLTYWDPTQDTCSAECAVRWVEGDERAEVWDRFANGPDPVGYDPRSSPGQCERPTQTWEGSDPPKFAGSPGK